MSAEESTADPTGEPEIGTEPRLLIVDLGSAAARGSGVIWSLPHDGDLDGNLIWLAPDATIDSHLNDEVDVVLFVQSGDGHVVVDGEERGLASDHLAMIPKGAWRSIHAGSGGLTYLSIHRRRGPLTIGRRPDPPQPS